MRPRQYTNEIEALFNTHHYLTVRDVCSAIPEANPSTIYRNISHLVSGGILKKIAVVGTETLYELSAHNHGHFVCDGCGLVEKLNVDLKATVHTNAGEVTDVTVRGVCNTCVN